MRQSLRDGLDLYVLKNMVKVFNMYFLSLSVIQPYLSAPQCYDERLVKVMEQVAPEIW